MFVLITLFTKKKRVKKIWDITIGTFLAAPEALSPRMRVMTRARTAKSATKTSGTVFATMNIAKTAIVVAVITDILNVVGRGTKTSWGTKTRFFGSKNIKLLSSKAAGTDETTVTPAARVFAGTENCQGDLKISKNYFSS